MIDTNREGIDMELPIRIVVHRADEGGYWAKVPALPGCVTEADSLDELFRNARSHRRLVGTESGAAL